MSCIFEIAIEDVLQARQTEWREAEEKRIASIPVIVIITIVIITIVIIIETLFHLYHHIFICYTYIVDKMLSEYVLAFKGVIMTVSFRNRVLIID